MKIDTYTKIIIAEFLILCGIILLAFAFVSLSYNMLFEKPAPSYEFREVYNLRCAGVNAIGCTTILPGNHFLIEYVPDTQRCFKPGCISINQTIEHEMKHTEQYLKYGRMWETE